MLTNKYNKSPVSSCENFLLLWSFPYEITEFVSMNNTDKHSFLHYNTVNQSWVVTHLSALHYRLRGLVCGSCAKSATQRKNSVQMNANEKHLLNETLSRWRGWKLQTDSSRWAPSLLNWASLKKQKISSWQQTLIIIHHAFLCKPIKHLIIFIIRSQRLFT